MAKTIIWKQKIMNWKYHFGEQLQRELGGIGVVEVILILVVLIGLVLIFKDQLNSLLTTIFNKITTESSKV
jgi:uncharacterized membrane protein YkgB